MLMQNQAQGHVTSIEAPTRQTNYFFRRLPNSCIATLHERCNGSTVIHSASRAG